MKYTPTPPRRKVDETNGYSDDDVTPARKRKRYMYDSEEFEDYKTSSTAEGDITISEVDTKGGAYVKIYNKGKEVKF